LTFACHELSTEKVSIVFLCDSMRFLLEVVPYLSWSCVGKVDFYSSQPHLVFCIFAYTRCVNLWFLVIAGLVGLYHR